MEKQCIFFFFFFFFFIYLFFFYFILFYFIFFFGGGGGGVAAFKGKLVCVNLEESTAFLKVKSSKRVSCTPTLTLG